MDFTKTGKDKEKNTFKITVKKKLKNYNPSLQIEKIANTDLKPNPEYQLMNSLEKKDPNKVKTYNEDFIKILSELKDIKVILGEHFKANAYSKAEEEIIKYENPIYSTNQIKSLPHIGKAIIEKLDEFINTGKVNAIEKEKNNPIIFLSKIYGIGPKKAKELINKGITNIDELKSNEDLLNAKQKIGIKYYTEINKKIPRLEIEEYKELLEKNFKEVAPPESSFEIVGSYRRGAQASGDIDIIITNKNNNINAYNKFLDILIEKNIVIEVLSRGSIKSMTIAKLNEPNAIARRLDFLYTPPDEYAFAVLYFTGSKYFNVVMRQHALDMGFSLNEHGIYKMIKGKKGELIKGNFLNEESIFEFLNLIYKSPFERKNAQDIQIIESPEEDKITISVKKKTLKKKTISSDIILNKFLKEGINGLKQFDEPELTKLFKKANTSYHCESEPIMTDNQYDILREYILNKYPENKPAKDGHADCEINIERNKVKLPYELWSMDKIKPDTNAITKWIKKYNGPYTISAKLDGMSALYSTEGEIAKLYTRGKGTIGYDISYFIPFLKLPKDKDITIRGELIISKENFKKYQENKSKTNKEIANARNLVSGIINRKTVDKEEIKYIDFIAYEVIKPSLKPSEQMKLLERLDINNVINKTIDKIDNEILSKYLIDWRESYNYEIDGIIVINDEIYPRPKGNPDYAFAFKMILSDQQAEAKVLNILWTPTKDGYLAPRVQIEPIKLGGSTINFVTGKNAEFIEVNKIGIGAVILLQKAGDVIPEIYSVIEPAPEALFPTEPYKWNSTHKEIILINKEDNEEVLEKNIATFFKTIEVEGLGPGNIHRIIQAGFKSIPDILRMTLQDFLKIDGFKQKLAEKIYNNIHKQIDKASLINLMAGSNIWGRNFGEKRFETIIENIPDILILEISNDEKIKMLNKVDGIAEKTSKKFVEHIPDFIKFLTDSNLLNKLTFIEEKSNNIEEHELNNKNIVTTGFRFDKEMIEKLNKYKIKIQNTINKQTNILIIKDENEESSKIKIAKEKDIPILTLKEFIYKYKF